MPNDLSRHVRSDRGRPGPSLPRLREYRLPAGKGLLPLLRGKPPQPLPAKDGLAPRHTCPPDARFCEQCGAPTAFLLGGLLAPWEESPAEN